MLNAYGSIDRLVVNRAVRRHARELAPLCASQLSEKEERKR